MNASVLLVALGVLGLCVAPAVGAVEVALAGAFGSKAAVVVDGGPAQIVSIGQRTREGVLLRSLTGDLARFEFGGRVFEARVGQHVVSAGGPAADEVSLIADTGGHFFADARVNGNPVRVVVDTGATLVSMGRNEAARLGIDYRAGVPGHSTTANGMVRVWRVKLDVVELRGMRVHGVDAAVHDSELPFLLLGMSFMNRMDWRREGDRLMLRKRY